MLLTLIVSLCTYAQNKPQKDSINVQKDTSNILNAENWDQIFVSVQIEAEFPGGRDAFGKYLQRNLNANVPANNGAPAGTYTVKVTFIVDNVGNLSDVSGGLIEKGKDYGTVAEAVSVIKKGPKWKPGIQNGRNVKSYRIQKIIFKVM